VDDAVIAALKRRARSNNRSLEGELREILRDAAFVVSSGPESGGLRLRTVHVEHGGSYGRGEIYEDDGR